MEKELLEKLNGLLTEKYEPILVIYLLRVPPQQELQSFATKLVADFGYKVLVLPGDIETRVELITVLTSDITDIKDLQNRVLSKIKELEDEYSQALTMVGTVNIEDE
tara:strand:- start:1986 stop:2306 length:321 start_codon:yes stop_codon:yes gene_type:complete